jgi:hypothetical protein
VPLRVAFLFLGETLLIPHLYPIVEALSALDPTVEVDLWAGTSTHEALLTRWSAGLPKVRVRRAPFFRHAEGAGQGRRPKLPPKIPTLLALAPRLEADVAVCAELTSLWLPVLLPFLKTRFVKTAHGAGSVQRRTNARRRATWRTLVPSVRERDEYLALGYAPEKVVATGYVKSSFRQRTARGAMFPTERPVILYTPHWQQHRSSWWLWGREIVAKLVTQDRYNVILAPHQRLPEGAPEVRAVLAAAARYPHIHTDLDSFSTVDGSYTAAADIYLGDTSSQVVEYMARPRPCVFLNAQGIDWHDRADRDFWSCGDVVDTLDDILPALDRAEQAHVRYRTVQEDFVAEALGPVGPQAPLRAARAILDSLIAVEKSPTDREFHELLAQIR